MNKSGKAVSRREFARRAALGAGAAALLPLPELLGARTALESTGGSAASAANGGAAGAATSSSQSSAQAPEKPGLDAQGAAEAEGRYQNILRQYGERFSDEQKADLKRL